MVRKALLTCHTCGQDHRPAPLAKGDKALCSRCGSLMARGSRLGPDATFVFSVTGLVLAAPAALLPFIGAAKLGDQRTSHLLTGVGALWDGGMRMVAVLVLLCGLLLPVALLSVLALLHVPGRFGWHPADTEGLQRAARLLGHWSIPEVQVLAVLVALMKLGSLVDITVGPAFWFYCAMAVALILAQQSFTLESPLSPAAQPS
jgi:paraquat-inducible protein A